MSNKYLIVLRISESYCGKKFIRQPKKNVMIKSNAATKSNNVNLINHDIVQHWMSYLSFLTDVLFSDIITAYALENESIFLFRESRSKDITLGRTGLYFEKAAETKRRIKMTRKRTKYKTILSTNMQRTDQPRKEGNTSLRSYFC